MIALVVLAGGIPAIMAVSAGAALAVWCLPYLAFCALTRCR